MANKQEIFILISCFLFNVFCYELQFEGCGINGWNCLNKTNNKIDVAFKCPDGLVKENQNILWGFKGLPSSTQAVTIEDCETSISVTIDTLLIASGTYPNLSGFVIKNVAQLIINETTFSIPELLKGAATVKFENIQRIISFNKNSIGGNVFTSGISNSMTSFNFEMKNVQIDNIKNRAIWWTEGEIPFKMSWDNVTVNIIEEDAIHVSDTKKNPNSKIFINNCKFGELKRKAFNIHSTDFQFMGNDVEIVEKSAFRIQSDKTTFIKNNFFKINNYAFLFVNVGSGEKNLKFESNTIQQADKLSMNFGAPYYNELQGKVSFRDNKFNCINSTWLQRGENYKIENTGGEEEEVQYYKYLKKVEKTVLESNENTCINLPCSITLSKFKELYAKNGPMKSYCN